MRIVVIDFESFFSRADGYTLEKLSTEAYIRNAKFQAHGAAVKWSADIPARWYDERQLRHVLKEEDWSDTLLVSHHAQFDHFILSQHYGVHPRGFGCTLSMARLLLGNHISVSLDSVRKQYGLAAKITPYGKMDGRHWDEMDEATRTQVAEGSCDEVESIWRLFHKFIAPEGLSSPGGFPLEELKTIDLTVRMFVEPRLVGDVDMLADLWESENKRKRNALDDLGVTAAELQSADKFAKLLEAEDIDPETKPGKRGDIYCFAKTDQFMRDLLEDDNPRVRALAEARLGQKSTLLQTRAATLGYMATRGPLPVYLRYAGAHTTRWSGGDGCLTADTQVLVLDIHGTPQYKNIIDVLLTDLVWDGEEFVEHDGVQFSGYREVISWDGVNGTPDHKICCGETWQDLSEALRTKTSILDCREPTAWEVEAARAKRRKRA